MVRLGYCATSLAPQRFTNCLNFKRIHVLGVLAGNGGLSLAEIDKVVRELYPTFDNKPALIRAYKAADRTGDGFITRKEFRLVLQGLRYFNGVWARFESLDSDDDRKLRFAIVATGLLAAAALWLPST